MRFLLLFDNYNVTVDTFLDSSKAFETADPNILLDKLFHYANLGVTGINLFNSTTPPLPSILKNVAFLKASYLGIRFF